MRSYILFLLILLPGASLLPAQNAQGAWKWFNTCKQSTGGSGYNRIWDMCSDPSDDLIVAGTYYKEAHFSGRGGTGQYIEAVGKGHWISNEKFYLAKYHSSGELAWIRTGVGGSNNGSSVAVDHFGNIYCLLSTVESIYLESDEGEEISYVFGTPNVPGTLLIKFSPEGKILWHLLFDIHGVGSQNLDVGPNGEVFLMLRGHHNPQERSFLVPSISGKDTSLYVYPPLPNRSVSTTFVIQYAPDGELNRAQNFGSDSLSLFGSRIAANPMGGFALGLHFSGHGNFQGLELDSRQGGSHSLILNYDGQGKMVYVTQFGKDVYTQHTGGPPYFKFDPLGRLVVATAVDYSPLHFSPGDGDDLLLKGFNQYTCYLMLLRLTHSGAVDWKYIFKDIDFTGPGSTIYPYWANPSISGIDIAPDGQIFLVGSALNHLKLAEGLEYKYDKITEGKHWRTRNPYLAAFDSCGNPFWLESIKVNRENRADYLNICLHQDGDLSFSSQLGQKTEYLLNGKPIVETNTQQLLFGRRKRPQLSSGACMDYEVIDTSHFVSSDSNFVIAEPISPPPADQPPLADSLPGVEPMPAFPQAEPCISALSVFPNPNNGNFNLQWQVAEEQEFEIRITNMTGQVLRTEKRRFPEGRVRMQFMGLGLAQGMYIATVVCKSNVQSIRLMVGSDGFPGK